MTERDPFERRKDDIVIVGTGSICATGRNPTESYEAAVTSIEDGTNETGLRELEIGDIPNFDLMAKAKGLTTEEERLVFFHNTFKCGAGGVIPSDFFPDPESKPNPYPKGFFRKQNQLVGSPIVQAHLALKQIRELLPELFGNKERMRSDLAKNTIIDVASGAGVSMPGLEEQFLKFLAAPNDEQLGRNYNPKWLVQNLGNMFAAQLASAFGIRGSQNSSVSACSASGGAMTRGIDAIRAGGNNTKIAIVGGSEYVTGAVTTMVPFDNMGALSRNWREERGAQHSLTSFGADRDGFIPGNAAGLAVLMERDFAEEYLKIDPLATVYGASSNSCQPVEFGSSLADGTVTGQSELMAQLFANIGVHIADIRGQLVHYTHGTGTKAGPYKELYASAIALGELARGGQYVGTGNKERIGHTLGAAFIMSVIDSVEAIKNGTIAGLPSTREVDPRLREVDPAITGKEGVDVDPEALRAIADGILCQRNETLAPGSKAMITSMGFGGTNAALLVGAP